MKPTDVAPTDELFTHLGEDGVQTSYAVTALYKRCLEGDIPVIRVPVDEQHALDRIQNRGVEGERLQELFQHPEWMKKPIMFIACPDGQHLLVDGTHRYVMWFAAGFESTLAYMVPWDVAKDFIVEGIAQTTAEQLMQHSHLTLLRKIFGTSDDEGDRQ